MQASIGVLDADGQTWDMKFSLKRSLAGNVARYITGVCGWMRAWGCREGDCISFEALGFSPLQACVTNVGWC